MLSSTHNVIIEIPREYKVSTPKTHILESFLNNTLLRVTTLLDYLLGMLLGAAGGWITGWSLGHIYLDIYEPVHLTDFEVVRYWYYLPQTFAQYGAVSGAAISILFVSIISRHMNRNRILDLYKKGITRPYDLAKCTGLSQQRVKTILTHNFEKENENEDNC